MSDGRSEKAGMWKFEHTIETEAPREAVWRLWEDIHNGTEWDRGMERARLNSPFEDGTRNVLKPRGPVGVLHARVALRFTLEEDLPGGSSTLSQWIPFGGICNHHELSETGVVRRCITHRVTISGPLALLFVRNGRYGVRCQVPHAMRRLVSLAEQRLSAAMVSLSSSAKRKARR